MISRHDLVARLDQLLAPPPGLEDSSNNGLQVEGAEEISRLAFGVDASLALFEAALEFGAQFLIVHHGISWGPGFRHVRGLDARRLRLLLRHDLNLYASHIPLDCHPRIGNNAVLARLLDLRDIEPFGQYGGIPIGCRGCLPEPMLLEELVALVDERLETRCSGLLAPARTRIRTLGIVSGGAADLVTQCPDAGVDCLLTGEFAHQHVHPAAELGIPIIAAGHYRTETGGLKALMAELEREFSLSCRFIDLPTGY